MFNFTDIQNANKTIKTTDIKGKQYAEVNQRIKAFRQLVPNGFIETMIDERYSDDDKVTMHAEVGYYEGDKRIVLGTGTAQEYQASSFINKTSFIENCETSAVGRALGMLAIGIDTSVASYEEVANAIENQGKEIPSRTPINAQAVEKIRSLYTDDEIDEMLKRLKFSDISQLKMSHANKLISARIGLNDQSATY